MHCVWLDDELRDSKAQKYVYFPFSFSSFFGSIVMFLQSCEVVFLILSLSICLPSLKLLFQEIWLETLEFGNEEVFKNRLYF